MVYKYLYIRVKCGNFKWEENVLTEIKLTELEAIQLTMEHGFDGEELESAKFKKLGCLDGAKDKVTGEFNNRAMIKFIRKLETLYHHVSVEGKGKKRIYTLSDVKAIQSKMQDDRKFNGYDEQDYLISKHVFNRLVEMDSSSIKSAYEWAIDCNAFNPAQINKEMVRSQFYDVFMDEDAEQVYNGFQRTIKDTNRSMIEKAFKWLEHENLVKVNDHYSGVKLDGRKVEIDKNTYDLFTSNKTVILKKYDVKFYSYQYHKNNETYAEMFEELEQLYDEMKMKLVFVSHSVQLLNTDIYHDVETDDFFNAYYGSLINKLDKKQSKSINNYANLYNSYKSFSLLSTLSIVIKDNERLNQLIESKRPDYFAVYLILNDRYKKGIKMSDRFYQELDEMELMLSGTATTKDEESNDTQTMCTHSTIDDIVDFDSIENGILLDEPYKYIPLDCSSKEEQRTHTYNNTELANAVDMIKLAFSKSMSQPIAVGSF